MNLELYGQIFEKYSNIIFHENPSCGSRVLCGRVGGRTDRQTDRHEEAYSRFSKFREGALKMCTGNHHSVPEVHSAILTPACHHPPESPVQSHQLWRPYPRQGTCYPVWGHDESHADCECSWHLPQAGRGSTALQALLWHSAASEHAPVTASIQFNSVLHFTS